MTRFVVCLLILLSITGCSGLQSTVEGWSQTVVADEEGFTPEDYLQQGAALRQEARWFDALSLLQRGVERYPEAVELAELRNDINQTWEEEQRLLESRLLLVEASSLLQAQALLEKLSLGKPNDPVLNSRMLYNRHALEQKTEGLVQCSRDFWDNDPRLARRCLQIANRIAPSQEIQASLREISQKLEEIEQAYLARREEKAQASQARKHEQVEKRKSERVRKLIEEAERERRQGALTNVMPLLEEALRQDPENREVRTMISETRVALENQAAVLIKLGDRLYRDEQLGSAIAVWRAALKLDPARLEITEKLERALRVNAKLESIRAESRGPSESLDLYDNP